MADREYFLLDLRHKPVPTEHDERTDCEGCPPPAKFTKHGADLMVWWGPNNSGYGNSLVHPWVGRYTETQVREQAAYYQLGKLTLAIPCEIVQRLAVPRPDRFCGTVGSFWCDGPGPVVINHSLIWDLLEPHAWMPGTVTDLDDAEKTTPQAHVERLDIDNLPPGYSWTQGRLSLPDGSEISRDVDREEACDQAWKHLMKHQDPPGLLTTWVPDDRCDENSDGEWQVTTTVTGPTVIVWTEPCRFPHKAENHAVARAGAWQHYWELSDLETEDGLLEDHDGSPLPAAPIWPRCLSWSRSQAGDVLKWYHLGGDPPEMLRARRMTDGSVEIVEVQRG